MTVSVSQIEVLAEWCSHSKEVEAVRSSAWRTFFGDDDPRPVNYWRAFNDPVSKQRRFLGWFMFAYTLPDGRTPAALAAERLLAGAARDEVLGAVQGARYVMAIVASVLPGDGVALELEDERFNVRSRTLSRFLVKDVAVVVHLVPSRPRIWVPGPGWVQLGIKIGPNMRATLKRHQSDPVEIERMLQGRSATPEEKQPAPLPRDDSLDKAVSRMTEAARKGSKTALIMSAEEWTDLAGRYIAERDVIPFSEEIMRRIGDTSGVDEFNRWFGLAMNIWNNVPQRDRGGKSAMEMSEENPELSDLRLDSWTRRRPQ